MALRHKRSFVSTIDAPADRPKVFANSMCGAKKRKCRVLADAKKLGLLFLSTVAVAQSFSSGPTLPVKIPLRGAYGGNICWKQTTRLFALQQQDGTITSFDPFRLEKGGEIAAAPVEDTAPAGEGETNMGEVWRARLLLVVAAALYGTNFTCVKCLDEAVPVGISTTLRFALAALATLPWLLAPAQGQSSRREGCEGSWWDGLQSSTSLAAAVAGLEVGVFNSIGYISQAVGLETTDASKSAFICSLAVAIVPILDHFAGKKILPREIVGCIMAVAGVGFLELGGGEAAAQSLSSGDIASFVQPLAFGLGFWRMEAGMHRFPEEAKRMTAAQIFAVFVASALYGGFMSGETWSVSQITEWVTDPMILFALFWTGCVTTALTVYMETLALKTLSAAETTMIFSTEPLWGAAFASAVVGEHLGLGAGIGAALILGGCLFSNMGSLDWLGGSNDSNDTVNADDVSSPPSKDEGANIIPKALFGPGLSVATPAVAIAALSAELSNDSSASTVGETIREKLGEI